MLENQLSRYGAIAKSLPFTFGKIFFVVKTSESYFADFANEFPVDRDGVVRVYGSVAEVNTAMRDGYNDVAILDGNSNHSLSSMLTISKNRVHYIGLDYLIGDRREYGQSTRITMGVTAAATDLFAVKNTGIRNSFLGIKFMSGNTLTQAIGTFGEGGEYSVFRNCEFYNSKKLNSDTHAEMVLNGDSPQFFNCTFGSLADSVDGNKVRPAILLTRDTVATGKVTRDAYFDRCRFWKNAGGSNTTMIKSGATDVERIMEFHDCQFIANPLGSTPDVAISSATLTQGMIILTGDTCATGCTKIATADGIFNCTPARVATATIGIQAT